MDTRPEMEAISLADDSSITHEQNKASIEQGKTAAKPGNCKKYQFRMRHVFYIHLIIFIVTGLLTGLTIYLIENYSASKNQQMEVSYVNAWFVSSTCMCGCGLTTLNFAKLSKASQIVLLFISVLFGITTGALPPLIIKAHTHKHVERITVDKGHGTEVHNSGGNQQSSTSRITNRSLPPELEQKFALLPTPQQIRYWAYTTIIVLIVVTCVFIYLCSFVIIGAWLDARYSEDQLSQGNTTINPWYTSIIIVITGFNQNGLTPFSDSMARFVNDPYMNIFVMMVVVCGTALFPFLLRSVVLLGRRLVYWRYKIVFDYILLNHHHLCTLLFPSLQVRIYLCITFLLYLMAISISTILDIHNSYLTQFAVGTRLLILVFHAVSARFAGFQTIDISHFTSATLIIYLLLMITKPQMLCALTKSRVELTWISLQENQERKEEQQERSPVSDSDGNVPVLRRRTSSTISNQVFGERDVNLYLNRKRSAAKEQVYNFQNLKDDEKKRPHISHLHYRLLLLKVAQVIFKHTMHTLGYTRTWLFFFIFLICAIEYERIDNDPNITVFKVVFEIISAFGCVGLTLGYPGVSSSFATILSPTSRVILGLIMLLGRHRGLLASMKDQEEIEHSANDLLEKWKEEAIHQHEVSMESKVFITRF